MKILVCKREQDEPKPAKVVETARGREIRGAHLLGIVNEAGQLVIKFRGEFVIVEDDDA